ncbi:carboxypeptidase Y-deficient [Naganishia albida]|nr:carboxypeptidase Y-deficient [Naganishia albida]
MDTPNNSTYFEREPVIPQSTAPFPSFRARSTSSSTMNANGGTAVTAPAPVNSGGGITSPAWLNALSDGLSWIESSKAAEKAAKGAVGIAGIGMGVGESIRDGLSARLAAAGGGESRRPLSFTGWGTQVPGAGSTASGGESAAGSTGRPSIDESTYPGTSGFSLPPESQDHLQPPRQTRNRPSSFLEYIRPSPPTPPPKRVSVSGAIGRPDPQSDMDVDPTTSRAESVKKPTLATSTSSPAAAGTIPRPQRRRLGPPQPANMSRLGSAQSIDSDLSSIAANGNPSTPLAQRFLRGSTHKSAQSLSYSGTGTASAISGPSAAGLASLPRSASSSTYSLQEQARHSANNASGNGGVDLTRSASSGLNNTLHPPASTTSGTSTPLNRHTSQRSRSHSLMQVQTLPQPQKAASQSRTSLASVQTPYRPGFQPAGVKTYRTEEFLEVRNRKLAEISKEEGRLGRRWGKLIDLHFNPRSLVDPSTLKSDDTNGSSPALPPGKLPRSSSTKSNLSLSSLSSSRMGRSTSFLSMDALSSQLDNVKPRDVWRGIRNVSGVGVEQVEAEKKREAEMGIVKWEEDKDVKRCRICQSSFSLTNRKHHCRLCGRIICSLPPTTPAILAQTLPVPADPLQPSTGLPVGMRRAKCSLLLVADWKTGRGQEVEEGFVGWLRVDDANPDAGGTKAKTNTQGRRSTGGKDDEGVKEVIIKGVRVCRECWQTVSRKQQMQDRAKVTGFSRLYEALKAVETEIADALPEFQEMIMQLQSEHFPPIEISPDTLSLHKQLVELFQDYEQLTKRIRDQPCEEGSGQWKLQQAIARASGLFISKEAGIIQMLPRIQRQRHKRATSSIASASSTPALSDTGSGRPMSPLAIAGNTNTGGGSDDIAMMLQPLLEQEAQIEEYIKEANAQRKFDDAKTLKISLEEIQQEIARLAAMS